MKKYVVEFLIYVSVFAVILLISFFIYSVAGGTALG